MSIEDHPRVGDGRRGRAHWAAVASLALALGLLPAVLLRYRLTEVRSELARQESIVATLGSPHGNVPILRLERERSDGDGAPSPRLTLDDEPGWVVFQLAFDDDGGGPYRVELRDGAGEPRWRGDGLERDPAGDLVLAVPSTFLAAGDYRLAISAPRLGERIELARYRFRVIDE